MNSGVRQSPHVQTEDCLFVAPHQVNLRKLENDAGISTPTISLTKMQQNIKRFSRSNSFVHRWNQQRRRQFFNIGGRFMTRRCLSTLHVNNDGRDQLHKQHIHIVKDNKIFQVKELVSKIASYLEFDELVSIRRVNILCNKELYFKFKIQRNCKDCQLLNYQIYFVYNNFTIISLIQDIVSSKLINIVAWWLQIQSKKSRNSRYPLFDIFKDAAATESTPNCQSNVNRLYLLSFTSCVRSKPENCCYETSPFKNIFSEICSEISSQINVFRKARLFVDRHGNYNVKDIHTMITSKDIGNLILGSYYGIKPLIKELNYCLTHNIYFVQNIQRATIKQNCYWECDWPHVLPGAASNALIFLYRGCFESRINGKYCLASYFDGRLLTPRIDAIPIQQNGRWSMFAQLSLTGNFHHFTNFIDKTFEDDKNVFQDKNSCINESKELQSNCHPKKTFDILMNGMTTMFSLYLRLDLLTSPKYNCHHCSNAFHGLPLETFEFAADPTILKHLKYKCQNTFLFQDTTIYQSININDNKHFHPVSRLFYLYNLCFSTKFLIGLKKWRCMRGQHCINSLRRLMPKYWSMNVFIKDWELKTFDDIGDNKEKHINIHKKFQLILQFVFGLADKFVIFHELTGECKLLDGIVAAQHNQDQHSQDVSNGYGDITLQSRQDVLQMSQQLINQPNMSEDIILDELHHQGDIYFYVVPDLHQFLLRIWNLF